MSGTLSPTVAAVPSAPMNTSNLLALMAALSGQPSDFNSGSQVRTLAEVIGAITEEQAIGSQALALQSLAYGAMSLFGIQQSLAVAATGTVIFATSIPVSSAPAVTLAIPIPSGTLVQTAGGVQFATTSAVTLASGTNSISAGIAAVTVGSAGNVAASAITGLPLSPLGYPLYAINAVATQGGADAGTQSQALAQFTSKSQSLGLSSPVAIANAAVGFTASGETVRFSSVYEPWIAAGSGAGSGTAGFTLYIDNGTGTASSGLVAATQSFISGSQASNQSGYRPAGVPYTVSATTPVYADVTVSGVLLPGLLSTGAVTSTITSNIQAYFDALGIAPAAAYQPQIAGQAADAGLGSFQSLTVSLYYSGSVTAVDVVSGATGTRVILSSLNVNVGVAT